MFWYYNAWIITNQINQWDTTEINKFPTFSSVSLTKTHRITTGTSKLGIGFRGPIFFYSLWNLKSSLTRTMSFMDYARKKKPCPRLSNSFLIVFRRTGQVKRGKKGSFFFCDCLMYFLLNKSNDLQVDGVRGWKRFTPYVPRVCFLV